MDPQFLRATNFLERIGVIPTYRNTGGVTSPGQLEVHTAKMESPLPLPDTQISTQGSPPPDRVTTELWHLPETTD